MELLTRIRNLCRNQGISIAELERKAGIGNGIIARWSKSKPSTENLKKVADYFGVSLDYLMSDKSDTDLKETELERKIRVLTMSILFYKIFKIFFVLISTFSKFIKKIIKKYFTKNKKIPGP